MNKKPFVTKEQLDEITAKFPTPYHLYDEKGIRDNAKAVKEAFAWNKGYREYFAVKACPNPTLIQIMKEYGCGCDCSSMTELMLSKAMGCKGADIMFSSNATPAEEYQYAAKLGAIINLDDITHIDFLEKDEGTDRENKKISNEIIFVEEGKIIFSITDGKTHNFWFEDKAPKYPLLKNCNDDKIFAKARILFNQESEENLYQAGIYVKSAEDKVYYMAIDNDRNCILDTIGENNRKEEFDNTNEYLIKMNLEADCLKVQFISDASTKELKMMIERLAPVEVGLMVKTWGNGGFLEVDFKESQAIISNK